MRGIGDRVLRAGFLRNINSNRSQPYVVTVMEEKVINKNILLFLIRFSRHFFVIFSIISKLRFAFNKDFFCTNMRFCKSNELNRSMLKLFLKIINYTVIFHILTI